jgi:hypothetical protein
MSAIIGFQQAIAWNTNYSQLDCSPEIDGCADSPQEETSGQFIYRSQIKGDATRVDHGIILAYPEQGSWMDACARAVLDMASPPLLLSFPNPVAVRAFRQWLTGAHESM